MINLDNSVKLYKTIKPIFILFTIKNTDLFKYKGILQHFYLYKNIPFTRYIQINNDIFFDKWKLIKTNTSILNFEKEII